MYLTPRIEADPALLDRPQPAALLARLCGGEDLTSDESQILFEALVAGQLSEPEIAALLVALKVKGETFAELIGAARALRAAALPFDRPDYLFADSCGTGGDSSGTINLSTAVAFVAAAAGLPIAKHGNRSVTSKCGSADVLEQLGVKIDADPANSRRALDQAGICFLFAPNIIPACATPAPSAAHSRSVRS
jgi:anthranilate phosphoribosyltransferase